MSVELNGYQFVDTNIFLYAYDQSDYNKQATASKLINKLWASGNGCISMQVLQELYVNLTRKVKAFGKEDLAKQIILDLGQWKLHRPDLFSLEQAIDIEHKYKISFWDAQIISSAHQLGCQILWSEDLNHDQCYLDVRVLSPFKN